LLAEERAAHLLDRATLMWLVYDLPRFAHTVRRESDTTTAVRSLIESRR